MQPLLIDRPPAASGAPRAQLLLAHGAGVPMDAPFMTQLASGVAARGIEVVRFEFPYMHRLRGEGKRSPPDRMPVLEACFREVVEGARGGAPLFLGGKSMGGRVATRIADASSARGVIALGYPFHPPKQPRSLRVEHLQALRTPCLIVQGTRDPLGSTDEVPGYGLPASIRLHWLADGDHSFEPRKSSGHTLAEHMAAAIDATTRFILDLAGQ